MNARVQEMLVQYRHVLPFLFLLAASLFFQASIQRIVFYVCVPFFVWTLWQFRDEAKAFVKTKAFALMALYLGYFTVSYFWSVERDEEFIKLIRNVVGIGLFTATLAVVVARTHTSRCFPMYLVWACAAYCLLACFMWYGVEGKHFGKRLLAMGRYINPIHFAFLISFATLIVVSWWMTNRDQIVRGMCFVAFFVFIIILSQTRTACVGLAICILALGASGYFRVALAFAGLCAFALIVAYFTWDDLFENMVGRTDSLRLSIWQEAIDAVKQKPLIGHGIASTPAFLPNVEDAKAGWESPHNVLIGHAYHGGVVGLGIFLCIAAYMMFVPLRNYFQARREGRAIDFLTIFTLLSVVYMLCASQFNFAHFIKNVHIQWLVFWVPFACVAALELRRKNAATY